MQPRVAPYVGGTVGALNVDQPLATSASDRSEAAAQRRAARHVSW